MRYDPGSSGRRLEVLYHLPAYVALQRLVAGKTTLVVAPSRVEDLRRLLAAGARRVIAVGADLPPEDGVERIKGVPKLPLADASVEVVACIESYGGMSPEERGKLLAEARRVLRTNGVFVAWAAHDENFEAVIDFWTLEEELSAEFATVFMIAELPWAGVSLAPVVDSEEDGPGVALDETLLDEAPEATHYLAVALPAEDAPFPEVLEGCLLVPMPEPAAPAPVTIVDEVARQRQKELERELEDARLTATAAADAHSELEARLEAEHKTQESLRGKLREHAESREVPTLQARLTERDRAVAEGNEERRKLKDDLAKQASEHMAELAESREKQRTIESDLVLAKREQEATATARRMIEERLDEARGELESTVRAKTELEARRESLEREREALAERVESAMAMARAKETDLAVLTRTVEDLQQALARANERAEARSRQLEAATKEQSELRARSDSLSSERDNLRHQLELAISEREGARQLSARAEAELDLTRRRLTKQEETLEAKLAEAMTLSADVEVLRAKLEHHQAMLDQSRSREEQLSATAAESAEQGRALTEVALDRDRLREELTRRAAQIQDHEEKLWQAREEVQKERLENVRLAGEVDRLRDQSTRSHEAESARAKDVERLSAELHRVELDRADLTAHVRTREEELSRLREEGQRLAAASGDLEAVRNELAQRGRELADVRSQLEQSRVRVQEAEAIGRKRGEQLSDVGSQMERLRRDSQENAASATNLQAELDVKMVEVEQLAATVADLQMQAATRRSDAADQQTRERDLQRDLERQASEQEVLRRRLREREQELEDLVSAHESSGVELYKLRRELDVASHANEQLEEALAGQTIAEHEEHIDPSWPGAASDEIRRLRGQLSAQSRRHAELIANRDSPGTEEPTPERERVRRLQREIEVRAQEQEFILASLDAAEQKIWEMTDASDRNAARLAASLAQLEKHKEQLDETLDELEVTRRLLAAAQARALEQERLLASERAKLARAGIDVGPGESDSDSVDALFADLEVGGRRMVDLEPQFPTPPAPEIAAAPSPVGDRVDTPASGVIEKRPGPRIVVERIEDDGSWPVNLKGQEDEDPPSSSVGPGGQRK